MRNPILDPEPNEHLSGENFLEFEIHMANRNCGTLAETFRQDITPTGAHYLLNHFDVPMVGEADARHWSVSITGEVESSSTISLSEIKNLPAVTLPVTLECAGNGRAFMTPRWPSQPWGLEAAGTSLWTGTSLAAVLKRCGIKANAKEVVFYGKDEGIASGDRHFYGRSMPLSDALDSNVMLVWQMNGQALPPQHGYPLRLVVPGWYGMASVKWLDRIELIDHEFTGHQQEAYTILDDDENPVHTINTMLVRSLLVPPGIPEWASQRRLVERGMNSIVGKAWSGGGVPIEKVEFADNGVWQEARLREPIGEFAWTPWEFDWKATTGKHELSCRATDANGNSQPLTAEWNHRGFCNNQQQLIEVWCA